MIFVEIDLGYTLIFYIKQNINLKKKCYSNLFIYLFIFKFYIYYLILGILFNNINISKIHILLFISNNY